MILPIKIYGNIIRFKKQGFLYSLCKKASI